MKNTYEKLDKSLNKDWTSFIEKLAKGTNNVEANLIVEKYKKGDSDIPPEAKQYLDSITGGGRPKKVRTRKGHKRSGKKHKRRASRKSRR